MLLEKEMIERHQGLSFLKATEALKTVTRQNKTLDGRYENSAEHSWQLALMAQVLAPAFPEPLTMERVLTMLLVHDLGEIGAGDTSVFDAPGREQAQEREKAYMEELTGLLPQEQGRDMLAAWQEFADGQSPEARFARCVDALAPLMTHLWTATEGDNPSQLTYSQVRRKKAFIQDESPALWSLVEDLLEASVERGLYHDDRLKSDQTE